MQHFLHIIACPGEAGYTLWLDPKLAPQEAAATLLGPTGDESTYQATVAHKGKRNGRQPIPKPVAAWLLHIQPYVEDWMRYHAKH